MGVVFYCQIGNTPTAVDESKLSPNAVLILATLSDGYRHGYAIRRDVEARTEGAVIGGVGGAVVGNQIGRHSVKCVSYPRGRYAKRKGCRWINDSYRGRHYSYEICRGPDGYWRPV